jgi:hypothetical protein
MRAILFTRHCRKAEQLAALFSSYHNVGLVVLQGRPWSRYWCHTYQRWVALKSPVLEDIE